MLSGAADDLLFLHREKSGNLQSKGIQEKVPAQEGGFWFYAMDEKRDEFRSRVLKAATISFGNGGAISCVIRNMPS